MRGGEHALVDGTHQHYARSACARTERTQELDAVGVGQMQLHHDQRGLERLEQLHEVRAGACARDGVTDFFRNLADEVDDGRVFVDDQQPIDVVGHSARGSRTTDRASPRPRRVQRLPLVGLG